MKREQLLTVGLGQCGCVLADLLKDVNKRFSTFYVNSSVGDLNGLNNIYKDSNMFIFSGSDGAGRDRNKAKGFLEEDKIRLASFIKKYSTFKYMLIFFGMGGGTGSGIIADFIKIVKSIFPEIIINIVGVLPSLKENKLELNNSIACCMDITRVSNLINDIKFINNEKHNNYNIINKKAINDINLAYGMTGHSNIGSIDENNLTRVTTCKGYGVILNLDDTSEDLKSAIEKAKSKSVFELPKNLNATFGAINTNIPFDKDILLDNISIDETLYNTTGNKNILCLGGCSFPDLAMINIEAEIKDRELKREIKNTNFTFKPKYETEDIKIDEPKNNFNEVDLYINDDDLDNLFDMNNFK